MEPHGGEGRVEEPDVRVVMCIPKAVEPHGGEKQIMEPDRGDLYYNPEVGGSSLVSQKLWRHMVGRDDIIKKL